MTDIRVLVVDDSAFMRSMLVKMLGGQLGISVVDVARNGEEALAKIAELRPDVITMDVEMPRLNGLQTLTALMRHFPTPVIMVSSLTQEGAAATMEALQLGAVDFIGKPSGSESLNVHQIAEDLVDKVRRAAKVSRVRLAGLVTSAPVPSQPAPAPPAAASMRRVATDLVIAVGASTGGPKALMDVLPGLPADLPAALLIVQHMPAGFTRTLAENLDSQSRIRVREAAAGDRLEAGVALVAPGDFHLAVKAGGLVELTKSAPLHHVRPAVDVMFDAVARVYGPRALAVVLTGMGVDGASGALAIKRAGGRVVAQDEATSVVYGMPAAVARVGAADVVVPLGKIAGEVLHWLNGAATA